MGAFIALVVGLLMAGCAAARTLDFVYTVDIPPETRGGELAVWLPLAGEAAGQAVTARHVEATLPGLTRYDRRHDNLFWAGRITHRPGGPVRVEIRYRIRRVPQHPGSFEPVTASGSLRTDGGNPVNHPRVKALLAQVEVRDPSPVGRVRALYDFVIDSMREGRAGSGWGRADGLWALRYGLGDQSDFAAFFVTLARAWGIPARLRFGVRLPTDSRGGRVAPHAWAEFHLEGAGWLPVDPAAAKRSGDRTAYFGRLPADRLVLWTGRDASLAGAAHSPPFLVYPHVELDGKPLLDFVTTLRFRERPEAMMSAGN